MTTGIPGSTARRNTSQQVGYARFTVNYNDANVANGNTKQWLPAGAIIIGTDVQVVTPFNAGTTNVLTVGLGASATSVVAAGQAAPGTAALTQNIAPTGAALGPIAADSQLNVTFTQTGAAATAGQAVVMVKFIPNNDL
ncbi:MAG: hypothetical protein AB1586_33125 [Pseudomonadota bacterium]